jgi:hypothetical protein
MKNFLRISNQGLIVLEDIVLIGSSTKRGDDSKIGQFGSGWKFALAWLMRNELAIKIFSGIEEIVVDFTVKMHRETPVKVLTVNGQETSITSGMGEIDWEGWMSLREIVSNAIDEGEEELSTCFNPEFKGVENRTTIFIEMNGDLVEVLRNLDSYFSFERKAIWSSDKMKIFKKEATSETVVFRKGIRCYKEEQDSLVDIDFQDIQINESRLSDSYNFGKSFKDAVKDVNSVEILKLLLSSVRLSAFPEYDSLSYVLKDTILEMVKTTEVAPVSAKNFSLLIGDRMLVPTSWYLALRDLGLVKDIIEEVFGQKNQTGGDFYIDESETALSEKLTYLVSGVIPVIKKVVIVKFITNGVREVIGDTIYTEKASYFSSSNDNMIACSFIFSLSVYDLLKLVEHQKA